LRALILYVRQRNLSSRAHRPETGTACNWYLSCISRVSATLEEAGRSETVLGKADYSQFMKGGVLRFSFDRPHDPNAQYRLAITGISTHDQGMKVPPIDFEPFRDTAMDM
jgi:hypothetical protein